MLRECFADLYSLDQDEYDSKEKFENVLQLAKTNPNGYVMKPQREGGGNNIYGEEIGKKMDSMTQKELSSFILMERVNSTSFICNHVKLGERSRIESISELGVYGTYVVDYQVETSEKHTKSEGGKSEQSRKNRSDCASVVVDSAAGYLLRSKSIESDEGGVATGYSVLDTVFLKNDSDPALAFVEGPSKKL